MSSENSEVYLTLATLVLHTGEGGPSPVTLSPKLGLRIIVATWVVPASLEGPAQAQMKTAGGGGEALPPGF